MYALFSAQDTSYRFARGLATAPVLPVSGMCRTTSNKRALLCLQRTGELFDSFVSLSA